MVLAHVEVLEALDTGMVDCHKFLYETHVHFALLDMKLLLVHYSEIAVVGILTSLWRDPYQTRLAGIRALHQHQVLEI